MVCHGGAECCCLVFVDEFDLALAAELLDAREDDEEEVAFFFLPFGALAFFLMEMPLLRLPFLDLFPELRRGAARCSTVLVDLAVVCEDRTLDVLVMPLST